MIKGNITMKKLISPVFDFTNKIPDKLVFYEYRSNTAKGYRLEVRAAKDGVNFDNLLSEFDTITTASKYLPKGHQFSWKRIAEPTECGVSVEVAWRYTNTTGILRLDDVWLTVARGFNIGITTLGIFPVSCYKERFSRAYSCREELWFICSF